LAEESEQPSTRFVERAADKINQEGEHNQDFSAAFATRRDTEHASLLAIENGNGATTDAQPCGLRFAKGRGSGRVDIGLWERRRHRRRLATPSPRPLRASV
jgi:hypothetical protein